MSEEWSIDTPRVLDIGGDGEQVRALSVALVGGHTEVTAGLEPGAYAYHRGSHALARLRAGDVVLTGSISKVFRPKAGDAVRGGRHIEACGAQLLHLRQEVEEHPVREAGAEFRRYAVEVAR